MLSIWSDDLKRGISGLHLFRVILQRHFGSTESIIIVDRCSLSISGLNRSFFLMQLKQEISPEVRRPKDDHDETFCAGIVLRRLLILYGGVGGCKFNANSHPDRVAIGVVIVLALLSTVNACDALRVRSNLCVWRKQAYE